MRTESERKWYHTSLAVCFIDIEQL